MKKAISLFLICMLSLATIVLPAGCSKKDESGGTPSLAENMLYDFEDYDRNFQLMKVMSYFGAVNVNRDKTYVRSGEQSALLQPLGYHSTMIGNVFTPTLKPESCLYIPLSSNKYEFDYTDAGKLREIRMAMYNAESTDKNVYVGLIFEYNAQEVCEPTRFTLKPGWNDVMYVVEHDRLAINYDLSTCYGIALSFDRVKTPNLAHAPKIFSAVLRVGTLETAVTPADVVELDENELCDFEKGYQRYAVTSGVYDKAIRPDLEIVTAQNGVSPTSGHRMLKVTLKPTDAIDGSIFDTIYLREGIVRKANISALPLSAKICIDVYNACDIMLDLPITFVSMRNQNTYAVAGHLYAAPGVWSTFSIEVGEVDRLFEGEKVYTAYPGPIRIEWGEFTGDENRILYVDNFRIER